MKSHTSLKAICLACAAALGVSAMFAGVARAASTSADATATIITPIAIAKVDDLRFGTFASSTSGTVVMSTAGARSATGGVVLPTGSAAGGAARFTVTGEAAATYTVTLPVGAATITSGANNMTVDTWTSNPGTSAGAGLLTGGTQTLLVGGTLNVGASQAAGTYTGSFSVAVEYN